MRSYEVTQHNYESDRPYRPYITFVADHLSWLDLADGIERDSSLSEFGAFGSMPFVTIGDDRATFAWQDTTWRASDAAWLNAEHFRALDPRIVVRAWRAANDARVAERCTFRDYARTVLTRSGPYGAERLYVDPRTGYVAKLDREESHYLWGQVHVEFIYATWLLYGTIPMPTISTELVDGDEQAARTVVTADWIPRDSSPVLTLPATPTPANVSLPRFLLPAPSTTRSTSSTPRKANPAPAPTRCGSAASFPDATQSQ
jgi:hypothetical protein